MNNQRNLILEYQRDYRDLVMNNKTAKDFLPVEEAKPVAAPAIEEQLAEIRTRLNTLGLFVGMPHVVSFDGTMTLYPARKSGTKQASDKAVSYTIDLRPFRDMFSVVRFKAMAPFTDDKDIVRGVVIDEAGNVECAIDNKYEMSNPWTRLPITNKSYYLVATVPLEDGKPAWVPERVEFLPQGLAQNIASVTEKIAMELLDINNALVPLQKHCKRIKH